MKRKILLIILMAFIFALIFTYCNIVKATDYLGTSEPEFIPEMNSVFCYGTPITIEARTDDKDGAIIRWENGEINVPQNTSVFGGGNEHEGVYESSSIIMNTGTIFNVYGGGLNKSHVENANIELKGGTITGAIYGGGSATNERLIYKYENGQENTTTVVDNVNITITGGTSLVVYGGAKGNGNTKKSEITIDKGNIGRLIAGGANGCTDEVIQTINGGQIFTIQGVNCGIVKSIDTTITGGNIGTVYVGGATIDTECTGIIENVKLNIIREAKVENLEIGTIEGKEIVLGKDNIVLTMNYDEGTVTNIDKVKFEEKTYIYITINENKYDLEKGKTLSDLDLSSIKNVEGKEFVKFVKKGTQEQIAENVPINENMDIQPIYKDIQPPAPIKLPFTDVKDKDWYYSSVRYVYENKMILGKTNTLFKPNDKLTRGNLVTILWRMEGSKVIDGDTFPDVKSNQYYYNAVKWAVKNKVVNGFSDGTFKPNANISRQQLAVMLKNYAQFKKKNTSQRINLQRYTDYKRISDYATDAISWAIANKVISGKENGTKIDPQGTATRGEVAAMLTNYCNYVGR